MAWTAGCKGNGLECYNYAKKNWVPCSLCRLTPAPGAVWVPKFTDYHTPGQPDPEERDYFCADCFRSSRPYESWCKCSRSLHWYAVHEREREANPGMAWVRLRRLRPSGPPPGTALAIPSPSAAASVSASSGGDINVDRPNLVHVVERLQQEITEMREQIETLENAVRRSLIQNAIPAQWQSRMQ